MKFKKLMLVDDCDFIKLVTNFTSVGDKWYDWFIGTETINNRTGDWFFGVVALKDPNLPNVLNGSCAGLTKADLLPDFGITRYDLRIFTGGCYYFNPKSEEWEGVGVSVNSFENRKIISNFNFLGDIFRPHTYLL